MKRIYSNNNIVMVWHVRNMLEQQGIDVLVKNDKLYSVAGEMPLTECMGEVWVKQPLSYRLAEQLVAEMEAVETEPLADWVCPDCGEDNGANFGICWNCQNGTESESSLLL